MEVSWSTKPELGRTMHAIRQRVFKEVTLNHQCTSNSQEILHHYFSSIHCQIVCVVWAAAELDLPCLLQGVIFAVVLFSSPFG